MSDAQSFKETGPLNTEDFVRHTRFYDAVESIVSQHDRWPEHLDRSKIFRKIATGRQRLLELFQQDQIEGMFTQDDNGDSVMTYNYGQAGRIIQYPMVDPDSEEMHSEASAKDKLIIINNNHKEKLWTRTIITGEGRLMLRNSPNSSRCIHYCGIQFMD